MEKAEIDSHTYDIYLDTWNSEQTITKIENQSLFRISHFLVIFISFLVNILHLRNSVLKRETLVKFYDPYIYAPAWGCISPCQRKASRSKKIQYILAIIWNGVFLRVVPNGSPQCVKGRGGLSEVAILWKPMIEYAQWGWVWSWSNGSHSWSSHFDPFYGQKLPKIAINGPFVAIRHPGGYKRVDQCGSRLDQGWAHPGWCVGTIFRVRNGHRGAP